MKIVDWEKPQRLSPIVLLFIILEGAKQLWPLILIIFLRTIFKNDEGPKSPSSKFWLILIVASLILIAIKTKQIIHYFSFKFSIQSKLLLIEKGVFTKEKIEIPFTKIQAIHQNQTFLHRLTHTCELIINTSGTANEEVVLKGISLENAAYLKELLSSPEAPEINKINEKVEADQLNKIHLTSKDLLKLCLSENHLKTLLLIFAFFLSRFQEL